MPALEIDQPSPWVIRHAALIPKAGQVLDLACGNGRHAIWLAQQGYQIDAVDRDAQTVSNLIGLNNITVHIRDLETGARLETDQRYDGIIVTRYLFRPLLPALPQLLNAGGVLIYETFMRGNERYGKPSNPDFLLRPNELLTAYSPLLAILAFEQGEEQNPKPAAMQRICAMKMRD